MPGWRAARQSVAWPLLRLLAAGIAVAGCGAAASGSGVMQPGRTLAELNEEPAATGEGHQGAPGETPAPLRRMHGTRPATSADVVSAAVATVVEPVVVTMPLVATALVDVVAVTTALVAALPGLALRAFCEQASGPPLGAPTARLERRAATNEQPAGWHLIVAGPLVPHSPGPLAQPASAHERKPVQLELRSSDDAAHVHVAFWTGGWLLCAQPSLQVLVDGRPLGELAGWPPDLDVTLGVDETGVRATFVLPAAVVHAVLSARQIEIRCAEARQVLEPRRSPAATKFREHLQPAESSPEHPAESSMPE